MYKNLKTSFVGGVDICVGIKIFFIVYIVIYIATGSHTKKILRQMN